MKKRLQQTTKKATSFFQASLKILPITLYSSNNDRYSMKKRLQQTTKKATSFFQASLKIFPITL